VEYLDKMFIYIKKIIFFGLITNFSQLEAQNDSCRFDIFFTKIQTKPSSQRVIQLKKPVYEKVLDTIYFTQIGKNCLNQHTDSIHMMTYERVAVKIPAIEIFEETPAEYITKSFIFNKKNNQIFRLKKSVIKARYNIRVKFYDENRVFLKSIDLQYNEKCNLFAESPVNRVFLIIEKR
jgi:hypothetical protein